MVYDNSTYLTMLASEDDRYYKSVKTRMGELRTLKSWMRMRIHFGCLELSRYNTAILNPGMAYEDFRKMMMNNRSRGHLDAK